MSKTFILGLVLALYKTDLAAPSTCTGSIDLTLVIDGSGSVNPSNFKIVKDFLKDIARELEGSNSRVSVIQFTATAKLEFALNAYCFTEDIIGAIEAINYQDGGTYIAGGMNLATDVAFTAANGDRASVDNVMVVLTDGWDGKLQDVIDAHNAATKKNITVLAIGVGNAVNQEQLHAIAGNDASKVFHVNTFNDLSLITGIVCPTTTPATTCPPVTTCPPAPTCPPVATCPPVTTPTGCKFYMLGNQQEPFTGYGCRDGTGITQTAITRSKFLSGFPAGSISCTTKGIVCTIKEGTDFTIAGTHDPCPSGKDFCLQYLGDNRDSSRVETCDNFSATEKFRIQCSNGALTFTAIGHTRGTLHHSGHYTYRTQLYNVFGVRCCWGCDDSG